MKRTTTTRILTALLCALALLASAQSYPSKAVVIIVPYAPGGITDVVERQTAAAFGERRKQSVIVDSRVA